MIRLSIGLLVVISAGGINDTAPLYMIPALAMPGLALMAWPILDGTLEDD